MTEHQIMEWQASMFIYTSLAYYDWAISIWPDDMFDTHCAFLLKLYPRLPLWFRTRVSEGDLRAGTGFTLVYSNDERREAVDWMERGATEGWFKISDEII